MHNYTEHKEKETPNSATTSLTTRQRGIRASLCQVLPRENEEGEDEPKEQAQTQWKATGFAP